MFFVSKSNTVTEPVSFVNCIFDLLRYSFSQVLLGIVIYIMHICNFKGYAWGERCFWNVLYEILFAKINISLNESYWYQTFVLFVFVSETTWNFKIPFDLQNSLRPFHTLIMHGMNSVIVLIGCNGFSGSSKYWLEFILW